MPTLTRWYIRTSFLYLLVALLLGVPLALRTRLSLPAVFGFLSPVYFHLFLVGWITQLIFGVIFWLFPKPEADHWNWERTGWLTWALLNSGLLLRVLTEPIAAQSPGSLWGWGLVLSAILQWLAGMGLILIVWPRAYSREHKRR